MSLSHSELQIFYARYLKSGMTLEEFCQEHRIPFWDMSEWINQWEKLHGAKFVENSISTSYNNPSRLLAPFSKASMWLYPQ